jgi:hypothetical protein
MYSHKSVVADTAGSLSAHGALVGDIQEASSLAQGALVGAIPTGGSLAQGALVGAIPAAGSFAHGALVGAMPGSLAMLGHGAVVDTPVTPPLVVLVSRKVVSGGALGPSCEGFHVAVTEKRENINLVGY